jgi:pyrroloquinoline quinone biosynthesis protein E
MPSRAQMDIMVEKIVAAREQLKDVIAIDFVVPDYYARRPKACMGGWGRRFLNISPSGKVLPCHAAESITSLRFDNVRERPLADIWQHSPAFQAFRGTDWMPEPCRSCDRKEIDWGGCRCQAFAITRDPAQTDPACALSKDHDRLVSTAVEEAQAGRDEFLHRNFRSARSLLEQ